MTRMKWGAGLALAAALAACGAPVPTPAGPDVAGVPQDAAVYPAGNSYRLLAAEELPIVGVTTDSDQPGFPKARLADGDLATQWSNGGYRNATAWAAVELAAAASLASVGLKTGAMPAGTSYDVQVSADGGAWTTVLANQRNTTWGLETRALPAGTSGKHVRILWHNDPAVPQAHAAIFELRVDGTPGTTPTPAPTATPSAAPTPAPSTGPTAPPDRPSALITPAAITASSTYTGLAPQRAIDADAATQWSNGGYREAGAWLQVDAGKAFDFTSVQVKTGALPAGVSYVAEVSADGTAWTAASGALTNTTWNAEGKPVAGRGRYLRLRFTNSASAPLARFSVYDLKVAGIEVGALNQPPVIDQLYHEPMFVNAGGTGTLTASAQDPDGYGQGLTYTWEVLPASNGEPVGTIEGSGWRVTYHAPDSGPVTSDGQIKLTVRDPQGGATSRLYEVPVYYGSTSTLAANQATEWDPAKAATLNLAGDVTVTATGDFAGYSAVICEYATAQGRQTALLAPGTTVLPGATGAAYLYLVGPTGSGHYGPEDPNIPGPDIPQPAIRLSFAGGGGTQVRTITQAQVAAPETAGRTIETTSHGPWHYVGESTAMNGQRPFRGVLQLTATAEFDNAAERFALRIDYALRKMGDYLPLDPFNSGHAQIMLLDSKGGLFDNTGGWTIYTSDKFMGP